MHASEGGRQVSANFYVYEDAQEASAACAVKMLDLLQASLAARPFATLAISAGSTPKLAFAELAKARFDCNRMHLFWVYCGAARLMD